MSEVIIESSDAAMAIPASASTAAPKMPSAPPLSADLLKLKPQEAVAQLIDYAVSLPASDLFFGAAYNESVITVRSLGMLRSVATVPAEVARRWVAYLKAAAAMDISEKRRPLDGRWVHRRGEGKAVDVRISTIPTLFGEDLAMRLLDITGAQQELNSLGMHETQYDQLLPCLSSPGGMILVTGPTGSGKTATLYAALRHLNNGQRKINTIEDPIEYVVPGIRQSQVNPQIDLGFATLLRAVLRQAPDVIMVGEIRDPETAHTAVTAANSGHLVLATVHAAAAALAPQSLRGLGVATQFLGFGLRCIVAQRLARTLCPACKRNFSLDEMPELFEEIRPYLDAGDGKSMCIPAGCDACGHTGYTGRTGIFEVMPVAGAIRSAIAAGESPREIRQKAVAQGMIEFRQSALLKVACGQTSTEEIFRVIPAENLLSDMMEG